VGDAKTPEPAKTPRNGVLEALHNLASSKRYTLNHWLTCSALRAKSFLHSTDKIRSVIIIEASQASCPFYRRHDACAGRLKLYSVQIKPGLVRNHPTFEEQSFPYIFPMCSTFSKMYAWSCGHHAANRSHLKGDRFSLQEGVPALCAGPVIAGVLDDE
jgi:hypothetical protein